MLGGGGALNGGVEIVVTAKWRDGWKQEARESLEECWLVGAWRILEGFREENTEGKNREKINWVRTKV